MFRGRATGTLAIGRRKVFQFKCEREIVAPSSPFTSLKRSRKTQRIFSSSTSANADMQRYIRHQLSRRLPSLERKQTISYYSSSRLFTSGVKQAQNSGKQTRKKKSLSRLSKKLTTKDRLRLSSRPSSSGKKSGQNDQFHIKNMMIKSPEELMERLNSGLDIARTAVQEGYATMRNPADKNLLSARAGPSSVRGTSKNVEPKGLVMDVNWWFWNLLFAASPSILVALYCQFIVIPEMKLRTIEREKDAESEGKEKTNGSENTTANIETRGNSLNKQSPIRKRQEERKRQDPKLSVEDAIAPPPRTTKTESDDILSSYSRLLADLFSGKESPDFEHGYSQTNNTKEAKESSTKLKLVENQKQGENEAISLEIQQRQLKELQSQLNILQEKINSQQQERTKSVPISADDNSEPGGNMENRESLFPIVGNRLKSATIAGLDMGREKWRSILCWWQTNRDLRRPSDEPKVVGIDNTGADNAMTATKEKN